MKELYEDVTKTQVARHNQDTCSPATTKFKYRQWRKQISKKF